MRLDRPWLLAASALTAASLGACAVGPDYVRPALPGDAGYTSEEFHAQTASADAPGGEAQQFVENADIPGQWWTLFHSTELTALIDEALKANPDVEAAQAALRQANETAYANQGALFPSLTANSSGTREKTSGAAVGSGPAHSQTLSVNSASLNISYAPDVFGGVRRQIESGAAQAKFQRFQLEATYLTLTSNVVNTAIALASLRDQIAATEAILKLEREQLDIANRRFALGALSKADVLAQQAALDQTRATLPPLQKQFAQARNQLMAYLGRYPSQDKGESFELASLSLPQELPVSLPSNLVEQRPDVRAAEAQLEEANANIGVAIANQLPQFTITGQLGSSSSGFSKLFTPGTGVWNVAGSAAQTIFDAGTLEHKKRASIAAYDQSAAQYRKTVLASFQDVANTLRALEADAEALKIQSEAEQSARESLDLARKQFQAGAIDNVTLLNTEQTYQNALLARVRAQAARYSDTAALFQALGGGWWNRQDIAPATEGRPDRFALPPFQNIRLPGLN